MGKRDQRLRELCKQLGKDYRICRIDFEEVIYRDFGNGFNVEISGAYSRRPDKGVDLYLWYGTEAPSCLIAKTVRDVPREDIPRVVKGLYEYSKTLQGYGDVKTEIFRRRFPLWNCAEGDEMRRIFYGPKPKFTDADRESFNRGKYECKMLLQNKGGQPVVISKCMEGDIRAWKVEYGFSTLVFATYEEALAYCRGRFFDLEGKAL